MRASVLGNPSRIATFDKVVEVSPSSLIRFVDAAFPSDEPIEGGWECFDGRSLPKKLIHSTQTSLIRPSGLRSEFTQSCKFSMSLLALLRTLLVVPPLGGVC